MIRSGKKTPISGITKSDSEKLDKRDANRRERRINKELLKKEKELKRIREVSDIWTFNKDGKVVFNEKKYPEMMRK